MIVDRTDGHLADVYASPQAQKIEGRFALDTMIEYLGSYAEHRGTRCVLYKDWAPLSFAFSMEVADGEGGFKPWFNGGLIFHGDHDGGGNGGAPTFSVCLSPCDGWTVHT